MHTAATSQQNAINHMLASLRRALPPVPVLDEDAVGFCEEIDEKELWDALDEFEELRAKALLEGHGYAITEPY